VERYCVLLNSTTQCPQPGLELGTLGLEKSALTMRPPRLPMGTGLILLAGILFSKDQKFARPSKYWFYLAQELEKKALLEEINCVQCPLYN